MTQPPQNMRDMTYKLSPALADAMRRNYHKHYQRLTNSLNDLKAQYPTMPPEAFDGEYQKRMDALRNRIYEKFRARINAERANLVPPLPAI